MIFKQAVLKTKGNSEKIEQKFLHFGKRAKKNTYLEDPGIYIHMHCPHGLTISFPIFCGVMPSLPAIVQDLSRAVHSHGLELSVEELRDMARLRWDIGKSHVLRCHHGI